MGKSEATSRDAEGEESSTLRKIQDRSPMKPVPQRYLSPKHLAMVSEKENTPPSNPSHLTEQSQQPQPPQPQPPLPPTTTPHLETTPVASTPTASSPTASSSTSALAQPTVTARTSTDATAAASSEMLLPSTNLTATQLEAPLDLSRPPPPLHHQQQQQQPLPPQHPSQQQQQEQQQTPPDPSPRRPGGGTVGAGSGTNLTAPGWPFHAPAVALHDHLRNTISNSPFAPPTVAQMGTKANELWELLSLREKLHEKIRVGEMSSEVALWVLEKAKRESWKTVEQLVGEGKRRMLELHAESDEPVAPIKYPAFASFDPYKLPDKEIMDVGLKRSSKVSSYRLVQVDSSYVFGTENIKLPEKAGSYVTNFDAWVLKYMRKPYEQQDPNAPIWPMSTDGKIKPVFSISGSLNILPELHRALKIIDVTAIRPPRPPSIDRLADHPPDHRGVQDLLDDMEDMYTRKTFFFGDGNYTAGTGWAHFGGDGKTKKKFGFYQCIRITKKKSATALKNARASNQLDHVEAKVNASALGWFVNVVERIMLDCNLTPLPISQDMLEEAVGDRNKVIEQNKRERAERAAYAVRVNRDIARQQQAVMQSVLPGHPNLPLYKDPQPMQEDVDLDVTSTTMNPYSIPVVTGVSRGS